MPEPHLLEAHRVNAGYGKTQVLWDVDLVIPEGSTVALLGANGAGKSTLLRAVMGLIPLWDGEVSFCGERIDRWEPNQRVRASISYMSEIGVFSQLNVEDNLRIGGTGLSARQLKVALKQTWEEFPMLAERRKLAAGSLSGGQRKLLGLAKALIRRPRLLILDEPSSGLSPLLVREMIEMLALVRERHAVTIFLAEQNAKVLDLADRVAILNGGAKGFDGPIDEFRAQTDIAAQFFGLSKSPTGPDVVGSREPQDEQTPEDPPSPS
jgi:branched-chain amino acid transport system ATP-binding protein